MMDSSKLEKRDYLTTAFLMQATLNYYGISRDSFDGTWDYAEFVSDKISEFEEKLDKEYKHDIDSIEAMDDFVGNNAYIWKNEIRGVKYYKVRAVIEVDALDEDVESAIGEVRDCLNGMEMQLSNGWCKTKTLRVFSDDSDGSYERE